MSNGRNGSALYAKVSHTVNLALACKHFRAAISLLVTILLPTTGLTREYTLEPVAVGTPIVETPLQTTEIINVGESGLSYFVDEDRIEDENALQGHGVPVRRRVSRETTCIRHLALT